MNSNAKPTLLLIDGHSLVFRAFYALSPDSFRTPDGQHTNAVHGFISMLLNILSAEKPTHLAVAFDLSRSSFRTEVYPEYKGTRGETPPEFNGQTELLREALDAMNIRTLTRENFEADDILASLADQGAAAGYNVFVVSGDRDTFQLIGESTTILYPVKGVLNLARMNDEAVREKYGVPAKNYPDLAALVGETSDNLPGIPGVGPKTAAKWLQEFGTLQAIFDGAETIKGKVGESLREHMQLAVRNRELNHLVRNLEFDFSFDDLALGAVDEAKVREVFAKLHFRSLTERVLKLRGVGGSQTRGAGSGAGSVAGSTVASADAGEGGSWVDEIASAAADATRAAAPDLPPAPTPSAVDFAAFEAFLKTEKGTLGLAFASDLSAVAVATETELFTWAPTNSAELVAKLGPWLADESAVKAVFDGKNLMRRLNGIGISLAGGNYDGLLLCYLLNPLSRTYALDDLVAEHLGIEVPRADTNQLVPEENEAFGLDAWLALVLAEHTHRLVSEQDQLRVYSQVDLPTNATLARMEHLGVSVDKAKLEALFDRLTAEVATVAQAAYDIIGHETNLASPKQLQTVLFDELGMTGTKAVKTGFSTNAEALTTLFEQTGHPFLERLLEHREVTKIRQIVETLLKAIEADGRIHTNYGQTGTSTGRLSSDNPNLQNIPIRSERGREIRDAFVHGEGFETLLTADYSQIEMRILAHLAGDEGLIEAFKTGEDLHRFVGSRIFGVAPSEVTSAMRSKVKAMSYGLVYGLSEYGLAKQLRMSNAEAKQLMADYFARFGGVRAYLARVVDEAKTIGYTTTEYGRRRPFDDLNSKIFQLRENARRAALNAPIQGTAADIMKLAMTKIDAAMQAAGLKSQMLLQVHDELVFEVASGELETLKKLVIDNMSNVVELSVPLEVQIGVGSSWDAAGH